MWIKVLMQRVAYLRHEVFIKVLIQRVVYLRTEVISMQSVPHMWIRYKVFLTRGLRSSYL